MSLHVLQDRAKAPVEQALAGTSSSMVQVAHLLAAGYSAAAVKLACAAGDVRLAALIQQVALVPLISI